MHISPTISAAFGPSYRNVQVGQVAWLTPRTPLMLECGQSVARVPLAFQIYGQMNADKSNVILVCHGLTGDQYAASVHPVTGRAGWWSELIGEGLPIDTNRYCVIATNVLGGCMGSWGPKSIDEATGKPYGIHFPVVTIADMVNAQVALVDALGIEKLFAVVGGSMGGMQALQWAVAHPARVCAVMPIATSSRHSAQNIAFHEIGRQAVMADPDWCGGDYATHQKFPSKGLAVARMTAHVTYVSQASLAEKFGRGLQNRDAVGFGFDADFQVESYLRHQGKHFVERFDPNSYLYITRAMDYFDLAHSAGGVLAQLFAKSPVRFCVISFSSDWCFPTAESKVLVQAMNSAGANVSFAQVITDKGHDAFLLDVPEFKSLVHGFLEGCAKVKGV